MRDLRKVPLRRLVGCADDAESTEQGVLADEWDWILEAWDIDSRELMSGEAIYQVIADYNRGRSGWELPAPAIFERGLDELVDGGLLEVVLDPDPG